MATFVAACVRVTTVAPFWNDKNDPRQGAVFFYLMRPLTPNAGSWGQDSSGVERAAICP